jgi:hypothetical protein
MWLIVQKKLLISLIGRKKQVSKMEQKNWQPKQSDVDWTRNLIVSLKMGGIWGTSYATFKKISNTEFELVSKNEFLPKDYLGFEIRKVEICLNHLGFKLKRGE